MKNARCPSGNQSRGEGGNSNDWSGAHGRNVVGISTYTYAAPRPFPAAQTPRLYLRYLTGWSMLLASLEAAGRAVGPASASTSLQPPAAALDAVPDTEEIRRPAFKLLAREGRTDAGIRIVRGWLGTRICRGALARGRTCVLQTRTRWSWRHYARVHPPPVSPGAPVAREHQSSNPRIRTQGLHRCRLGVAAGGARSRARANDAGCPVRRR